MNKKSAFVILLVLLISLILLFAFLYFKKQQPVDNIINQPIATSSVPKTMTNEEAQQVAIDLLEQASQQINASSTLIKEREIKQVEAINLLEQVSQQISASSTLAEELEAKQAEAIKFLEQASKK